MRSMQIIYCPDSEGAFERAQARPSIVAVNGTLLVRAAAADEPRGSDGEAGLIGRRRVRGCPGPASVLPCVPTMLSVLSARSITCLS